MNTSLHLPDSLFKRLDKYMVANKERKISRNSIIVAALQEWLDREEPVAEWSEDIRYWCQQPEIEDSLLLGRDDLEWGDFSL